MYAKEIGSKDSKNSLCIVRQLYEHFEMLLHQDMAKIVLSVFLILGYHFNVNFARVDESSIEITLPLAPLNLHSTTIEGIIMRYIQGAN